MESNSPIYCNAWNNNAFSYEESMDLKFFEFGELLFGAYYWLVLQFNQETLRSRLSRVIIYPSQESIRSPPVKC